jgi:ADP-ribose pyrophosphatase
VKPWKTLARRVLLERGPYLTVEEHTVELPDGTVIPDWPWIVTPDYVIVVAVTVDGAFICFRQPKYAAKGLTLAPVGGYLDEGEDPLVAARRELLEETGYEAPEWHSLGRYAIDGNWGVGTAYLFLALGARRVAERDADDLEEQIMLFLSRDEIEEALATGAFQVLPWTTAMALALLHLER